MTQGGYEVIINLPMKSKMAAAKEAVLFAISVFTESSPPSFKVRGLRNDYEFGISVSTYR